MVKLSDCLVRVKFRNVFHLFLLPLLLCGGSVGTLQAAGLVDIYRNAQENDPSFNSAHFQTLAIEEGRKQAVALLLPKLSAFAEYKHTDQDIVSSDNDVYGAGNTDFDATSYGLKLTQPIFHWDSIVGLKQSKATLLKGGIEYVLAQQELVVRVAALYLKTLEAQDQLDFAEAEQLAVEKHFELASGRHEMGLIPITDMHDAKARRATTMAETIAAQNNLDDAFQALEEMTGLTVADLNILRAEIPLLSPEPADLDSWVAAALEQNQSIKLQILAVEIANQEVRRRSSGHYPTLDLVGRYNNEDTSGSLFGGASEVETTEIMLQFNLPLYQGGAVSSKVREAKQHAKMARQDLVKERRGVTRQVRSAYLGVYSALSRIDALYQSVVSNQLALDAKQEGFLSGLYTSLTVLDAERDLSLVSIDYAQARYDYILNTLKLKLAVGTLNGDDLLEIDQWFIL
ncbi:MAG: TolC family outer membrane protein [Desulfuromonadales bacterium]|nr:TolC family outer membrane protein [Desulfuromonadales bacterium]